MLKNVRTKENRKQLGFHDWKLSKRIFSINMHQHRVKFGRRAKFMSSPLSAVATWPSAKMEPILLLYLLILQLLSLLLYALFKDLIFLSSQIWRWCCLTIIIIYIYYRPALVFAIENFTAIFSQTKNNK